MNKIDLGQTITILANVGVIAGIVFLGIELQQNNELLSSQIRSTRVENRLSLVDRLFDNLEVIELLGKEESELTGTEIEASADFPMMVGLLSAP